MDFTALKSVLESLRKPLDYYFNNVVGTLQFLGYGLWCMDLVEGHLAALENLSPGSQVYNLGTRQRDESPPIG